MKILLSPAKSMNEYCSNSCKDYTYPIFLDDSKSLIDNLKQMNPSQLQHLMKLSPTLAELNYNRFQSWSVPFTNDNSFPCGWAFSGAAYKGLDFQSIPNKAKDYAQKSLRILSGLYGVLKPFDLIQPYRLEMGTRLNTSPNTSNLYKFWGDKLTKAINAEINEDETVVNLASNEYFKAIKVEKLKGNLINCVFKENKKGEYKIIMSYAKTARGLMSRFIIENFIDNKDDLIAFNTAGYVYSPAMSSENNLVFIR